MTNAAAPEPVAVPEPGTAANASTSPVAPPAGFRMLPLAFTGSTLEYFRIWIVNLFFTLVTLGIYSAWAKVRKKRYFYGSTRLNGDTFDYFGGPKAILKGRIIAFAAFAVYFFAAEFYPQSVLGFYAAGAIAAPFLLTRALSFNARNSAYRGLRFDFTATTWQVTRRYAGMLALVVVTFGIAIPWFLARHKAFVASHHIFGKSRFMCELPARRFFGIYFRGGLILVAFGIPGGIFIGIAGAVLGEYAWLAFLVPSAFIYMGYAVAYAYSQARTTNLLWDNTFGPGLKFSSSLGAAKLARIYLVNLLAISCSLGLLIPWAVIRTLRYRFENFAVLAEPGAQHEASGTLAPIGATGQELGDFFNIDFGL